MTPSEYLPLAQRTEKIPEGEIHINPTAGILVEGDLFRMLQLARDVDAVKKWIVYGVPYQDTARVIDPVEIPDKLTPAQFRILHALLGKISELGELIECLLPAITTHSGGIVDTVNLAEEMGDDEWYDAILMNVFLINTEAVLQCNIDKLRARYPEKFTEDKAVNRDLERERAALESR